MTGSTDVQEGSHTIDHEIKIVDELATYDNHVPNVSSKVRVLYVASAGISNCTRYVTSSPKAISHAIVLDSELAITSLLIAPIVLKLVATLSCHVLILHHHPHKDVQDNSAIFVAIYAVGILSCNLALTAIVVVSQTCRDANS